MAIKYPNYLTAFFKAEMMKRLLSLTATAPQPSSLMLNDYFLFLSLFLARSMQFRLYDVHTHYINYAQSTRDNKLVAVAIHSKIALHVNRNLAKIIYYFCCPLLKKFSD
jgi:hypothetical protein